MDSTSDSDSGSYERGVLGGPKWLRIAKIGVVATLVGRLAVRRRLPLPLGVQQIFSGGSMVVAFMIVRTAVIDIHHYLQERRIERRLYSPVESQGSCVRRISSYSFVRPFSLLSLFCLCVFSNLETFTRMADFGFIRLPRQLDKMRVALLRPAVQNIVTEIGEDESDEDSVERIVDAAIDYQLHVT